jgi:hypothetical protein
VCIKENTIVEKADIETFVITEGNRARNNFKIRSSPV